MWDTWPCFVMQCGWLNHFLRWWLVCYYMVMHSRQFLSGATFGNALYCRWYCYLHKVSYVFEMCFWNETLFLEKLDGWNYNHWTHMCPAVYYRLLHDLHLEFSWCAWRWQDVCSAIIVPSNFSKNNASHFFLFPAHHVSCILFQIQDILWK